LESGCVSGIVTFQGGEIVMIPIYVVDAFTDRAFAGNPAAVCLLESWPADGWLAAVAAEMKHAETAFLVPEDGRFHLRWLTPTVEVDLCGHATLASAAVLWHVGRAKPDAEIVFSTRSGLLTAARRGQRIELDFPVTPPAPCAAPAGLLEALGVSAAYFGKTTFDYFVEVESEAVLRRMSPDFRRLAGVNGRGVIVTARSADARYDFVSRFFAPAAGVDEDPVTGSAHCALAPFWHERLGKPDFEAFQASARGGVVGVRLQGKRVKLAGQATLVLEGKLCAAASADAQV
jgi:PhzF family phenazine biosynthesis protein